MASLFPTTPTIASFSTYNPALIVGNNFVPLNDVWLTALRWYRRSTTQSNPASLTVWDVATQTRLARLTVLSSNTAVGWKTETLPASVHLVAGRTYNVAWFATPSTSEHSYCAYVDRGTPDSPLTWGTGQIPWYATGEVFPNTSAAPNNTPHLVDVIAQETDPGAGTPATPTDVANELAAWLSTTDGTHTDSAPLQDHTTLATVDTNTADVKAQADEWAFGLGAAAHGYFGDLKGLISDIKTITDTLPTPIAQLTSIVLDHYTADIDMILGQIDSVLSGLGAQSTDLSGTAGSAVGALSGRTGFPATGWTMAAEADFEDAIAFAEPADAYVLSITSYQPTQPATESPAGLWLPRLGWWCVLNGSLATQRQFVDFQQMILEDQGRRMPGCAIQLKPGTLATVQAWLLA